MELFRTMAPVAMLAFVLSSMIAMGLGLTVGAIVAPLKHLSLVVRALVANFVVMPLVAFGLGKLFGLEQPLAIGLLLLGAAAGAPFLPKLAQVGKANLAFAVGLMVLLMVTTVGYLPLALPMFLPGVSVNPLQIARSLLLLMLLPLAVALGVRAKLPVLAEKVRPALNQISTLSLAAVMLCLSVGNFTSVVAVFGTGGILAGLLFIAVGLGTGWLLGGPAQDVRQVMGLGTAQRNIAAALVVGGQSFSDPNVVVMVVVVALVGLVALMGIARFMAGKAAAS